MNKIPIKEALLIWEQKRDEYIKPFDIHPDPDQIYRFSKGMPVSDKQKIISHLYNCKDCRNQWVKGMMEEDYCVADDYYAVAYLKAAASKNKLGSIYNIKTDDNKLEITFRKNLENDDSYLITLTVLDNQFNRCGELIEVKDNNDRMLLKGILSRSEISGWIDQVDGIDPTKLEITISGKHTLRGDKK